MRVPPAEKGTMCPLHKKDVSTVCHKCAWYFRITGKNPQTEETVDDWRCAIAWSPMLLINAAQETRQGAAATENFRNELIGQVQRARQLPKGFT